MLRIIVASFALIVKHVTPLYAAAIPGHAKWTGAIPFGTIAAVFNRGVGPRAARNEG
jgi:hypothetical protein